MESPRDIHNIQELRNLVKLLRKNGDKVLSASSKLCLSNVLLHDLNTGFAQIVNDSDDFECSFQVCNSSKIDIFRDIKFLHDFVQKTIGLKIIYQPSDEEISVDISKFRHLKCLELKKIQISLVKGIQKIRDKLESIICAGRQGVSSISQLLVKCGGDAGTGFVWSSLRHLALPHNALKILDTSLELAPWLQVLDLSHNLLKSATELSCLPNLKYVNLGYNKLETVPTFNKSASHSLQVLVLKNNFIDNIDGLQGLESLTELDLSYNCLTEHPELWPLTKMSSLLLVTLEGNPLAYHPKHRTFVIKYLNSCLTGSKCIVDHTALTKSEKLLIADNRTFPIRTMKFSSKENLNSLTNSINSSISTNFMDTSTVEENSMEESLNNIETISIKSKRRKNVKEAIIADEDQEKESNTKSNEVSSLYSNITSKDHLETKKQILALREKFGEDHWLSSHGGTFVQDIMGLQNQNTEILISQSLPTRIHIDDYSNQSIPTNTSEETEETEQLENDETEMDEVLDLTTDISPIEPDIDEDVDNDIYLIRKKINSNETEELFLIINENEIKERDTITGKIKYTWSTSSVLSCVLGRGEPITVDIIFDTVRKDRQNRRYFAELEDAKKIVSTIEEHMKINSVLKIFQCLKCSTQFSQDAEYTTLSIPGTGGRQLKCPSCTSTLVVQTDESATSNLPNKITNLQQSLSESLSSIGGTEGESLSITTSLVHFDSHPRTQAHCSATSLDESRESTPSTSALTKKYESDIEVLSNPSQSSIEILDESTKANMTPSRKRSSEERRTSIAPSLLTIPDTIPVMAGLTESSSSGSLTDSICTAYENKTSKPSFINETPEYMDNTEKETRVTPVTNITSMLGGILQSMKIGSNKSFIVESTDESKDFFGRNINYSYTDFSSVDHRLKLHMILKVFEWESEKLVLLLRADILLHNSSKIFPGCLVLSTSKLYVMRIDGTEGDDPQRWLHKEISWTIDKLRSFSPLPFKQGIAVELQVPNKNNEDPTSLKFICILQDFQRTSNFLFYINDFPLPANCDIFSVSDHTTSLIHKLVIGANNDEEKDSVRLLALFSSATLKINNTDNQIEYSALIITTSTLIVTEDDMQWLIPGSDKIPNILNTQMMSNLIGIEHHDTSLSLMFLDEVAGLEDTWTFKFVSTGAIETVINSIQPPWEELFSIPLQVTTKTTKNPDLV